MTDDIEMYRTFKIQNLGFKPKTLGRLANAERRLVHRGIEDGLPYYVARRYSEGCEFDELVVEVGIGPLTMTRIFDVLGIERRDKKQTTEKQRVLQAYDILSVRYDTHDQVVGAIAEETGVTHDRVSIILRPYR